MNISTFFYVFENTVFDLRNQGCTGSIVSSISRQIRLCDMESCYKNLSETRNVTFIFLNFQKINLKTLENIEKIHMDSEKLINSFEMN